jgi:hypothetical protein
MLESLINANQLLTVLYGDEQHPSVCYLVNWEQMSVPGRPQLLKHYFYKSGDKYAVIKPKLVGNEMLIPSDIETWLPYLFTNPTWYVASQLPSTRILGIVNDKEEILMGEAHRLKTIVTSW